MTLSDRIEALDKLSTFIRAESEGVLEPVIVQSIAENPWFTPESVKRALLSISTQYLSKSELKTWSSQYDIQDDKSKRVGLVLAGNIPMVGIHDIVSTFIAGHHSIIKYSSKDKVLIKFLIEQLEKIDDRTKGYFTAVERVKDIDAVIATGGSTAATHFHYYFSKYPNLIRKNRSSVAILTGQESTSDLKRLGDDIFTYFGLGCRNVSKVFVPKGYKFDTFYESIIDFQNVIHHNKYKNNYDYSHAIYILGQHHFLTNNFLIVREDPTLGSRISCIHFEQYDNIEDVVTNLKNIEDDIQCIASTSPISNLPFTPIGSCQSPALSDYADRVDTMAFLTGLYG